MDIYNLVGLELEACRFSKSSYTFEFAGRIGEEFKTLLVSTSYNFSLWGNERKDSGKNFSSDIWEMLEGRLESVVVDDDKNSPRINFRFESGASFDVWSNEPLIDNMLIVTDQETGDWFPVC